MGRPWGGVVTCGWRGVSDQNAQSATPRGGVPEPTLMKTSSHPSAAGGERCDCRQAYKRARIPPPSLFTCRPLVARPPV